jgi:hypothetical protein
MEDTEHTHTLLYRQDPDQKIPQRMAFVAAHFNYGDGTVPYQTYWRARVMKSGETDTFHTKQQAKDWAQAVVILNH